MADTARHAWNLRQEGVDGIMLGWTLGGYPSPNLEVVAEVFSGEPSPESAMESVAKRRFGNDATAIVRAWRSFSVAFAEFPFHWRYLCDRRQLNAANIGWKLLRHDISPSPAGGYRP